MSGGAGMSDCGCEKARLELESYLREELCREGAAEVREHLDGCPDCADEARVQIVITQVVRRSCRDEVAPADLKLRVLTELRACCRD